MTLPFTADDVANMRAAMADHHPYTDLGVYIAPADLSNLSEYGQPLAAGSETPVICSFSDTAKLEKWNLGAEIEQLDGEVGFASVTPQKGGRFRLLQRFGQAVAQKTYEIVGINDRGPYGFVCALRVVSL